MTRAVAPHEQIDRTIFNKRGESIAVVAPYHHNPNGVCLSVRVHVDRHFITHEQMSAPFHRSVIELSTPEAAAALICAIANAAGFSVEITPHARVTEAGPDAPRPFRKIVPGEPAPRQE
jgi:hypothetical protein